MLSATILRIPNPEHEAKAIAAIRERKRLEALGCVTVRVPGYHPRDRAGKWRRASW